MNDFDAYVEIPKYRKSTKSSTSKSSKKSKHKHQYTSVLLHYDIEVYGKHIEKYNWGQYCVTCGKIGGYHTFESERVVSEDGSSRYEVMSNQEILDKYAGLPIVNIDPFSNKYVPL